MGCCKNQPYRCLLLWNIDQRCTNRSREDDISAPLRLENLRSSLGRVECPIEVDIHNMLPLLRGILLSGDARCDTRVYDHDIEFSKILHNVLHCCVN